MRHQVTLSNFGSSVIVLAVMLMGLAPALADSAKLPVRTSPIPKTTNSVPHIQIGVRSDPAIREELLRRVADIPGVYIRGTVISLPGAKGFWVKEGIELARPEVIVGGREFAHMHPDGSLHASLPPRLAIEAVKAGWATPHPWSSQRPGWKSFVMIYTPGSADELEAVLQLVGASFGFVTGQATSSTGG